MYRLHFTAADLARIRVEAGPGPFAEAVFAAERLRRRAPAVTFRAWLDQVRGRLDRRTHVLSELFPRQGNGVDLVTLVGPATTVDEGLDCLLGTPLTHLRTELEWFNKRHHLTAWSRSLADTDAGPRGELAEAVAALHDVAVRPYWTRIDVLLRADRIARLRTAADAGPEQLLATLNPSHVRWINPTLHVDLPLGCDADIHLGGRGLILRPSVFVGPLPYLAFDLAHPDAPVMITYPVINDLVTARQIWAVERPAGHLAALLGRSRSAILESIADGAGTVELARRLDISPASVSQHTAVLRNSGLISTRRDGQRVIHVVTSLGAMLLDQDPDVSRPR